MVTKIHDVIILQIVNYLEDLIKWNCRMHITINTSHISDVRTDGSLIFLFHSSDIIRGDPRSMLQLPPSLLIV